MARSTPMTAEFHTLPKLVVRVRFPSLCSYDEVPGVLNLGDSESLVMAPWGENARVDESRAAELLRRAGLQMLPGGVPADPVPLYAVSLLASCSSEDGRRDAWVDGWVDEETPGLVERANAGWISLVSECGLFGREREFLLGVPFGDDDDEEDTSQWRRVRLLDAWDLFGVGAGSGLLGSAAGRPEFMMSSLDGGIAVRGTTYQRGVTSIVVPEPWRAPTIRTHMERIVARAAQPNTADVPKEVHDWAHAWLRYVQHRPD